MRDHLVFLDEALEGISALAHIRHLAQNLQHHHLPQALALREKHRGKGSGGKLAHKALTADYHLAKAIHLTQRPATLFQHSLALTLQHCTVDGPLQGMGVNIRAREIVAGTAFDRRHGKLLATVLGKKHHGRKTRAAFDFFQPLQTQRGGKHYQVKSCCDESVGQTPTTGRTVLSHTGIGPTLTDLRENLLAKFVVIIDYQQTHWH
jgi:hypothetical protein